MLISTKGRYALRVMVDLAENYSVGNLVSLKSIAERQEISEKYLENIMSTLVKANLLETQRGKGGGFKLIKPAKEYDLLTILNIAEGNVTSVSCLNENTLECKNCNLCRTLPLWKELNKIIEDFLSSKNLDDLIENKELI